MGQVPVLGWPSLMIVVRLFGGLGNQMFQYAAARRAAMTRGVPLRLDLSAFGPGSLRTYALSGLRVDAEIASPDTLLAVHGPSTRPAKYLHRLRRRWRIGYPWTWLQESWLSSVDPRVMAPPLHSVLEGYWQSEQYFIDIADTIRREFVVATLRGPRALALAAQMTGIDAVSLHIRRGDYVTNPQTNAAHGTCSIDYYQQCAALVAAKVRQPHFFLFSDDPQWVAANLVLDHPMTLVSDPSLSEYDDLRLMSSCRHHIIANSSFSWWGAWLNPSPDKIVLAPARWGSDSRWNDRDLIPPGWIRR